MNAPPPAAMDQQQLPLSPPSEPTPSLTAKLVPLDSPVRTTPIHEVLSSIRVPGPPLQPHQYNPVTCEPIHMDDGMRAQLEQLRQEFPSPEAALKEQEQVAREIKQKMEEAEKKREEVQKAMDKKIKERNTEMKVLSKYQKVKALDIPS